MDAADTANGFAPLHVTLQDVVAQRPAVSVSADYIAAHSLAWMRLALPRIVFLEGGTLNPL